MEGNNNNNNNNNVGENIVVVGNEKDLNNISYEKYNRSVKSEVMSPKPSPNKKIQMIINKNDKRAITDMYDVLDSSEFSFALRFKKVRTGDIETDRNMIKAQIDTHKKSDLMLQIGVDGFQDSLIINPKDLPRYQLKDDETEVLGDFSSDDSSLTLSLNGDEENTL
jgi:hypothetical protein